MGNLKEYSVTLDTDVVEITKYTSKFLKEYLSNYYRKNIEKAEKINRN